MMDKSRKRVRDGFTIIELSLSLVFLSTLSLIVALMVSNAISSYNKGITVGRLNTEGADLMDEFRTAVQGSPATSMEDLCKTTYMSNNSAMDGCTNDHGKGFVIHKRSARVVLTDGETFDAPIYGAFCTGKYSYLWNSGYFYSNDVASIDGSSNLDNKRLEFSYKVVGGSSVQRTKDYRLIRVIDDNRAVCKVAAGYVASATTSDLNYNADADISGGINISNGFVINEAPTELISSDTKESSLALYDLNSSIPVMNENSSNMIYIMSFVLGTIRGGANVMASGDYCKAPEDYNDGHGNIQNFDYCAINKFNFAAQTVGGN